LAYVAPVLLLDRLGPRRSIFVAAALILIVAAADYATGYEIRLSILYLGPIALAAWSAGTAMGMAAAAASTVLWLFSFRTEHFYLHPGYFLWEAAVMLCGFLAYALLIARLRRALTQADERFFGLIEEMHAAVYVADEQRDRIVYANAEMMRIAGAAATLTPRQFERQFLAEAGGGDVPTSEKGFSSGTVKDARSGRWYLMQSGPIPWGSKPEVKLKVLTDITEQKNSELLREKHLEIMHRAAKLATLAEIASTLAHEINQPLMVIATYTDACQRLLEAGEADRGEIATALQKCHAQAVRAASIIERLREFVRQPQYRPGPCDRRALVLDAVDMMRPQLDEAQVAVDLAQVAPGLPIVADRILLVQLLVNLIRNAIDAMRDVAPAARTLCIAVSKQEADAVRFAVADRGIGFDTAAADQMFSPFYTTKADGLGLGLAICRSVAEAHGGRLWAEGNAGGGAVFCLSLPAGRPD